MLTFIERKIHEAGADPRQHCVRDHRDRPHARHRCWRLLHRGLVDLGYRFALDDFGTGFGSFTYLKRLPVDYSRLTLTRKDVIPTSPISTWSKLWCARARFRHQTIAEGVEDEETLTLLRIEQVDFAQGFPVGRPAPIGPHQGPA